MPSAPDPATMFAILTMGNGGYDQLRPMRVPLPRIGPGEAALRVLAAGMNNTEINTRLGWYSSSVTEATGGRADAQEADAQSVEAAPKADGGWAAPTPFPFIQGTDCCGEVVAVGRGVDPALIGRRALVRACMRTDGFEAMDTVWMGSDFNGAFAQYVTAPAREVFPVECDWSDAELATIPCAYGTAETMLERVRAGRGDHVLVTGASGGVGSAAVQLALRRGARVTAVAGAAKCDAMRALGAEAVARGVDLVAALGENVADVVIDNVAGPGFPQMLKLLRRGGRYASSGAIAGPVVSLDMRDMYLKDITLHGSTAWDEPVFPNLIGYIERGEIGPLLAGTFPLSEIAAAQRAFLEKIHVGSFVLIPPAPEIAPAFERL